MVTSSLIFLNAMMSAVKWLSAMKLRSSFSYRIGVYISPIQYEKSRHAAQLLKAA